MKEGQFLNKLRKRQLEVSAIPVQDLGLATPFYKFVTPYFKNAPWKIIILAGIIIILLIRLVIGNSFVHLVSILQEGF